MNVGGDTTIDGSVSSGTNLCPKNRVRFSRRTLSVLLRHGAQKEGS